MSDKPLRIRTAEWLGWVEQERETFPWYKDESRIVTAITYARGDYRGIAYLVDGGKTEWEHCWDLPDYPADLGACAEVLDAARHRRWRGMFDMAEGDEPRQYVYTATFFDPILVHNTWASVTADTLPAAICEAFCQAVEANRE